MEKNILVESIAKIISNQIPNIESIYKPHWINSSTDLQRDLDMSWGDMVQLFLTLEKETGKEIVALPIQYAPSFKIGYLVNLCTYAMTFDSGEHESELLKYAYDNVPIYKETFPKEFNMPFCHPSNNNEHPFHDIGTEFDCIASNYYSKYQYGDVLYNKVVELSGDFRFSMCTATEKLLSELPLWRKRKEWYGVAPKDKSIQFVAENIIGNRPAPPKTTPYLIEKGLCMVIPEHILARSGDSDWLNVLTTFSPKWLRGTSCAIYSLSIKMHQLNISLPDVSYIELEAENPVSADIVGYIRDTFTNADIAVVIANNHTGPIFITCPNGHYHCVSSKPSISQTDDKNQDDFPYSDLRLTSYFCVTAPVIEVDLFLRGNILNEVNCTYQNGENIVDILPACGFDGFADKNNAHVSVATIKMCIDLVNSEYNNPIAAMQITQIKSGTVRLYLLLRTAFSKWEKKIAESITTALVSWGTPTMEWELVFQDELFPCQYTGAKIYYQNRY